MPDDLLHNLDRRLTIVETKFDNIENKVCKIGNSVDAIETHILKQNGAIPRLKDNVDHLQNDMKSLLSFHHKYQIDQAQTNTKTKLIWVLVSSMATSLVLLGFKILWGMLGHHV